MKKITHEYLCDILLYDPITGEFRWKSARPKILPGQIAGSMRKGYVRIKIDGASYSAHRLAWFYVTGNWPADQIDHKNNLRSDNRFENLREATNGENRANTTQKNRTGFKGVKFHARLKQKPYEAQITFDKKVRSLGCFATAEEAHEAYKKAAAEYHGEFSRF